MSHKEKLEEFLSQNAVIVLVLILGTAFAASLIAIITYAVVFFHEPVDANAPAWGQLGDFFGGVLNPVFGFLSVMALLVALVLQSRELKESSVELKNSSRALAMQNRAIEQQRFEQTFFSWLATYRDALDAVRTDVGGSEKSGLRCLKIWHVSFLTAARLKRSFLGGLDSIAASEPIMIRLKEVRERQLAETLLSMPAPQLTRVAALALHEWEELYQMEEYQLDSLFRILYRLLMWIDSQNETQISLAQKWLYVSIVRGQLSWVEMVFLFYNGYTVRGKKFKVLAEKYALFDNLTFSSDAVITIIRECPETIPGYAEKAFHSALARGALGLPASAEETLALAAAGVNVSETSLP